LRRPGFLTFVDGLLDLRAAPHRLAQWLIARQAAPITISPVYRLRFASDAKPVLVVKKMPIIHRDPGKEQISWLSSGSTKVIVLQQRHRTPLVE
jgi:hypothetical protein